MTPLSQNDIESELSYAYLHAVASKIGANCQIANRHADNRGVDVQLTAYGPFPNGKLQEVDLKVQLKATVNVPSETNTHISYSFKGIAQYNDLRNTNNQTPRILVVLFLPKDAESWLEISEEALALKKAAYWVSLRGAPESSNEKAQTVYLPKNQLLTPQSLQELFSIISQRKPLEYRLPS